jgi:hypothetical protein
MMSRLLVDDKKERVDERIIVAVPTRTRIRFKLQAASPGWLRSRFPSGPDLGEGAGSEPTTGAAALWLPAFGFGLAR